MVFHIDTKQHKMSFDFYRVENEELKDTFNIIAHSFTEERGTPYDLSIVASGGKTLKAHKFILGAASPFLRNILNENPNSDTISIPTISLEHLELLFEFIYRGETYSDEAEIRQVMEIGVFLDVETLKQEKSTIGSFPFKQENKDFVFVENLLDIFVMNVIIKLGSLEHSSCT